MGSTANQEQFQKQKSKTLFIYGTTFSQRENTIIGKVVIEIDYSMAPIFISTEEY